MNRISGTVAGSLIKWVAIPVALAALGFYVIGPRVAKSYLSSIDGPRSVTLEPEAEVPGDPRPTTGAPKVNVVSEKLKSPPPRRRRPKPKPPEESDEGTVRVNAVPEDESPEPPSDPNGDPTGGNVNGE